jgi:hypothetical protein
MSPVVRILGAGHHQRPEDGEARFVCKRAQRAYNGVWS